MKKSFFKSFTLVLAIVLTLSMSPLTAFASNSSSLRTEGSSTLDGAPSSANTITKSKGIVSTATTKSPGIVASSNTATTTTTKPATTPVAPAEMDTFKFAATDIAAFYKGFSGKFMVSPITDISPDFVAILNTFDTASNAKLVTVNADEMANKIEGSFLVVFRNGIRRVYALVGSNTIQVGDKYYQVPAESYAKLKAMYDKNYNLASFAQWIIYMKPSSVKSITLEAGADKVELDAKYNAQVLKLIRGLRVTTGESYSPKLTDFTPSAENIKITIKVGETGVYTLMAKGNTLYIENDELRIGCKHTIVAADMTKLVEAIKNPTA